MKVNRNYSKINESYLFSTIAKKVEAFSRENPQAEILRMGIGDVTLPLAPVVSEEMQKAAREMGSKPGFHGYGPEQGYGFLREAVSRYYASMGVSVEPDEIFVSDGAKSDLGNILDLFDADNTVLIPDPVYPVYVDTNVMAGRKILFMKADASNGFLPMPDYETQADLIYICSPNNPTGAAYSEAQLSEWVRYAKKKGAVILYDAAYEAFITDSALARSIYRIEGAKECAIEFCSLSKTAGFTGTRCGYTVVPFGLKREGFSLHSMWLRRQTTKFNGVSYIVQRGAAAAFSEEGLKQIRENISYYRENARILSDFFAGKQIFYTGGKNSPYIWFRCPGTDDSWEFFDRLLERTGVVGTPGCGFGENGKGYFRMTAFAGRADTLKAVEKLDKIF